MPAQRLPSIKRLESAVANLELGMPKTGKHINILEQANTLTKVDTVIQGNTLT